MKRAVGVAALTPVVIPANILQFMALVQAPYVWRVDGDEEYDAASSRPQM
jgi:hypothetical protein